MAEWSCTGKLLKAMVYKYSGAARAAVQRRYFTPLTPVWPIKSCFKAIKHWSGSPMAELSCTEKLMKAIIYKYAFVLKEIFHTLKSCLGNKVMFFKSLNVEGVAPMAKLNILWISDKFHGYYEKHHNSRRHLVRSSGAIKCNCHSISVCIHQKMCRII